MVSNMTILLNIFLVERKDPVQLYCSAVLLLEWVQNEPVLVAVFSPSLRRGGLGLIVGPYNGPAILYMLFSKVVGV